MNPQTIRRIKNELASHQKNPEPWFRTYVDPENIANVHFTFRGPPDSPFSEGLYHGVIMLSDQYPMKPPNIQFLHDNGRFEVRVNVCLNFTSYHEEQYLPTWNIYNMILALRSLMTEETPGAIGSISCNEDAKRQFAVKSKLFTCKVCGCVHEGLDLKDELPEPPKAPVDTKSEITEQPREQTHARPDSQAETLKEKPQVRPQAKARDADYVFALMQYKAKVLGK